MEKLIVDFSQVDIQNPAAAGDWDQAYADVVAANFAAQKRPDGVVETVPPNTTRVRVTTWR